MNKPNFIKDESFEILWTKYLRTLNGLKYKEYLREEFNFSEEEVLHLLKYFSKIPRPNFSPAHSTPYSKETIMQAYKSLAITSAEFSDDLMTSSGGGLPNIEKWNVNRDKVAEIDIDFKISSDDLNKVVKECCKDNK